MQMILRAAARCLVVAACLGAAACQSSPQAQSRQTSGPTRLPPEEIQAEIMGFADSYTAVIGQAADRVAEQMPQKRALLHSVKLRNVENAIIIAAGPNPVGGLLDMTVMVTLQRQVFEEYWIQEQLGEPGRPLLEGLQLLEEEIWSIARQALDEQQVAALEQLIPQIRERYRGQVLVSSIRASDFADARQASVVRIRGAGACSSSFTSIRSRG